MIQFALGLQRRLQWQGRAKPKSHKNAHFGSDHVFADRHSSFNIFTFASLRRARYFSAQAQRFMQFSVALFCHLSLLLCTSAANNNGDANNAQNAHFGSDRTFVDRHSGFNNFLSRSFVTFRYFCAPARRTTMARRDTVKTHTSAQTALLSTGTAVSTFFCALLLFRDAQKRAGSRFGS